MKTPQIPEADNLQKQIFRYKCTLANLKNSHAKQIRIMIGDFTPVVVCDSIFPTEEFKREYMKRLNYLIIELENKLVELHGTFRIAEIPETH